MASAETCTRQRQRRCVGFTALFNRCISDVKKDYKVPDTLKDDTSLNDPVGKNAESQSNKKNVLERKLETEEVKTVSSPQTDSKNTRNHSNKSYKSNNYDCRKYSDFNGKESDFQLENHSYRVKGILEKKHVDTYSKTSTIIKQQDKKSENYIEFEKIKHSREILSSDEKELKIMLKNDVSCSLPISSTVNTAISRTTNLPAYKTHFVLQTPQSCSTLNNTSIFPSREENYIPPPVECHSYNNQDSSSTASERSETYPSFNGNSESVEDCANSGDETYFSLPDKEQIEAITNFIKATVKQKSVSRALADRVVQDLNALFRDQLEGHTIDLYGSYSSGLAISTSDINLLMISDCSVRKSFMYEVYKVLAKELEKYCVYPFEEGISAHQIKISFAHPDTGVKCQLAYLGKYRANICKMGTFLKETSDFDKRVKILIIATKIWSECLCINEVEEGKLHPVGYALMVIHFLQHCENPILPVPCEHAEKELLPPNDLSIGELWLAFLKYYSITFNWKRDVITVNSNVHVSKKSKGWENYWIAVEDPFREKNIAESVVNSDVADYIKASFKSSYEYFCNPPESNVDYSPNKDDENNGGSSRSEWQYSFQQCVAEQDAIFCEKCDELLDTCDECQKKMYVQPMLSVPKMTDSFLKLVKESLITVYEKYMLSDDEINERQRFVEKLQTSVRTIYRDAELNLFGSSANGFGFRNSDLDICITFTGRKVINTASVLKDVRFLLRKDKNFDHVVAIFNAQIPILKFHYQPKGWRGDISLANTLAIHNSNLLHTYSLLDERCRILGCALKLLAKKALVAEVTEKALSSYSYLNMVIYFLQQTNPPVLPVLQDNKYRKDDYKLHYIVENCNVWFCKDVNYIKEVFKTENKTPVEQLWLELLDYYCLFDSNKFVSIRQKDPVCISENRHSARLFNIQDPFIETKNLGCVVSAKKAQETQSVLNRARILFRTPVKELPTCVKDIEDFFFSTQSLTGKIHKEVYCDLCGKFGHERQECKQSCLPLQRNNFRRFAYRNMYNGKNSKQRHNYRGSYRKQPNHQNTCHT